jgi:hypothetical protein
MAKRRSHTKKDDDPNQARLDELGNNPGQVGPDSGGQSGDTQGLSEIAEAGDEDIEELADTDQAYEADVLEGVEEAGDNPERPVHTHENRAKSEEIPDPDE